MKHKYLILMMLLAALTRLCPCAPSAADEPTDASTAPVISSAMPSPVSPEPSSPSAEPSEPSTTSSDLTRYQQAETFAIPIRGDEYTPPEQIDPFPVTIADKTILSSLQLMSMRRLRNI